MCGGLGGGFTRKSPACFLGGSGGGFISDGGRGGGSGAPSDSDDNSKLRFSNATDFGDFDRNTELLFNLESYKKNYVFNDIILSRSRKLLSIL